MEFKVSIVTFFLTFENGHGRSKASTHVAFLCFAAIQIVF
jgi:hypothetical protein